MSESNQMWQQYLSVCSRFECSTNLYSPSSSELPVGWRPSKTHWGQWHIVSSSDTIDGKMHLIWRRLLERVTHESDVEDEYECIDGQQM